MAHVAVEWIAEEVGYPRKVNVKEIGETLSNGASLGIEGEGRWLSKGVNNVSVKIFGDQIVDSLFSDIKEGFLYGPIKPGEIPWEDFKCGPMTVI